MARDRGEVARPKTTLAFVGRSALDLWSRMDADQQDKLLLAAEAILGRAEVVRVGKD